MAEIVLEKEKKLFITGNSKGIIIRDDWISTCGFDMDEGVVRLALVRGKNGYHISLIRLNRILNRHINKDAETTMAKNGKE